MSTSKLPTLLVAATLVLGILLALFFYTRPATRGNSLRAGSTFTGPADGDATGTSPIEGAPAIVPQNTPVVTGFVGDLALKGNPENDGTIEPFVVGAILKLEAEAHNAVEYRWTANGAVVQATDQRGNAIVEKEPGWSVHPERIFDLEKPGNYVFTVQVRGAEKEKLSQPKSTALTIPALKIMRFAKLLNQPDDHYLTGSILNLRVDMARIMKSDLDFYRFRYSVNDAPVKHPDDGEEWTPNDSFSYALAAPGIYNFKVEARRADAKTTEDTAELPETIVAGDAVLLSFNSSPSNEKGGPVGSPVYLTGFPFSRFGKSECRVGVKKINTADFTWLPETTGALWGSADRTWIPLEPGNYLVRCEIREIGKETADDSRELVFTVTDGNF